MKRFCSSDSLAALISTSSPEEEKTRDTNQGYSREFQAMLDSLEEEDFIEESTHMTEKKRRLTLNQVKALEKNFEVGNKLEPERKLKLAEELDLQPRQVAIWFQNRRARWKTKQLERDYGSLQANYEALKHDYSNLEHENEALSLELKKLRSKFKEEKAESRQSVKEEYPLSESENNASVQRQNHDFGGNTNSINASAINDNSSNVSSSSHAFTNWIQFSDSRIVSGNGYPVIHQFNHPHVKLEEHQGLFSAEESYNFFSVDQVPTLHCYSS